MTHRDTLHPSSAGALGPLLLLAMPSVPLAAPAPMGTEMCETAIIATFFEDPGSRPDDGFVTDLARKAGVHLTFLRLAAPGLYVFSLSAPDSDPSCREALERLRRDVRVRSVDEDARRKPYG
jgi:hypothetical protein